MVKVSPTGRLHLPADVRRALGLKGTGQVVITLDDDIRLSTAAQALERARLRHHRGRRPSISRTRSSRCTLSLAMTS